MFKRAISSVTPHFCRMHHVPSTRLGAGKARGPKKQAGRAAAVQRETAPADGAPRAGEASSLLHESELQRHASAWRHSPWAECPRHK